MYTSSYSEPLNFYQQMLVMYPSLAEDAETLRAGVCEEIAVHIYDGILGVSEIANYITENNITCSEFFDGVVQSL